MSKNPPLATRPIQCNLTEALGELENLWARIPLAVFGKRRASGLPDNRLTEKPLEKQDVNSRSFFACRNLRHVPHFRTESNTRSVVHGQIHFFQQRRIPLA